MDMPELQQFRDFVAAATAGTGLQWHVRLIGDAVVVAEFDQVASFRDGSVNFNERLRLPGDVSLDDAKAKIIEKLGGRL